MKQLASCMDGFMRSSTGAPLLNMLPFVRYIAPEWTGFNNLVNQIQPIRDYIKVLLYGNLQLIKFIWCFRFLSDADSVN